MTGPSWELVPDSICTKSREAPHGPSIRIPAGVKELAIGRGVKGEGHLPLWPQISTYHCRVWMSPEEPHQWYLEDRSTNGTCVNAERVPKGSSRPLREGDRIKLAALTEDSEKIVQYVFTKVPGSSTGSPNQESTTKKRPREQGVPSSPASKRLHSPPVQPAAAVDTGVLQKLRKSNDDYRKRLQDERQATEAARATVQELEAKVHDQEIAAAQSADSALGEAKAEIERLKEEMSSKEAAFHEAQQDTISAKDELEKAGAKLQALQSEMHKLQNDAEELGKQLKSTRNDMQQAQKESQRREDAQKLAEERTEAALRARRDAEQACSSAKIAQQEAERSLHAARQHLQDIEDARSSAEEKVACLEAALQQSVSRLAEVREFGAGQDAAARSIADTAKSMAAAVGEAVEKLLTKRSQEMGQLDSLQQLILGAGLADTSPNTQATIGASPLRSHQNIGHANGGPGTQQASPVRSHRQNGFAVDAAGTQQEHTRLKGSSSEVTHPQRSSSRSVTSQPADKTEAAGMAAMATEANLAELATLPTSLANQATQPAADLQEAMAAEGDPCENEEPTAAQWRVKLPRIAEASAECNGASGSAQQVQFAQHAFRDNQGTLETPSLFPGSNQQPPSLAQPSTAAGSEEKLQGSQQQGSAGLGPDAAQEGNQAEAADSPTADRENVPANNTAPFSQSQGKVHPAAEDAGNSLRLSLQGAGGQGAPEAHAQEWEDMD